jgi:WD40 repeat protein
MLCTLFNFRFFVDTISVWHAGKGTLTHTLMGHTRVVTSLHFIEETLLASGGADGSVRVHCMTTGSQVCVEFCTITTCLIAVVLCMKII